MSAYDSVLRRIAGPYAPNARGGAVAPLPERRRWRRERTDAPVYIELGEHVLAARVINKSVDGALLEFRAAELTDLSELILHFADRTHARVDLRWKRAGLVGVRWQDVRVDIVERLHIEHLGREHLNHLIAWQRLSVGHARRQSTRQALTGYQGESTGQVARILLDMP